MDINQAVINKIAEYILNNPDLCEDFYNLYRSHNYNSIARYKGNKIKAIKIAQRGTEILKNHSTNIINIYNQCVGEGNITIKMGILIDQVIDIIGVEYEALSLIKGTKSFER